MTTRFVLSEAEMELEMDFLGAPRSAPSAATQHGMRLVARRHDDDDGDEPSRFSAPGLPSPVTPDVPAAAHHRKQHSTAPSTQGSLTLSELVCQVHAIGMRVSPSPSPQPQDATSLAASTRVVDGVGAPASMGYQIAMATSYLQGSKVVHNAASTTPPRCSTAQLTIFYAGSVHVFDNVTREQAEQIMLMATKVTQAGSPPVRLPLLQPESAAALPNERQMAVAKACDDPVRLSPVTLPQALLMPGDVPLARNESLVRFLDRRKRRVASAALPYSRRAKSPGKVETFPMVSPGNETPFGSTEQSWIFGNAKDMNGSHDEEALDTELKI